MLSRVRPGSRVIRRRRLRCNERAALAALIGVLALPELVLQLADAGFVGAPRWRYAAYSYGALWQGLLDNWRPNFTAQPVTMFASYGLLHVGLGHLAGNLAGLVMFLPETVRRIGIAGGALVVVASLLGGAVGFVVLSNSAQPMVGASGAVYGVVAAWIFWDWRDRRQMLQRAGSVWAKLAALIAANVASWWALSGALAWEAHLGGALCGVLVAWWLAKRRDQTRRLRARRIR